MTSLFRLKLIAAILSVCLLFSLTACAINEAQTSGDSSTGTTATTKVAPSDTTTGQTVAENSPATLPTATLAVEPDVNEIDNYLQRSGANLIPTSTTATSAQTTNRAAALPTAGPTAAPAARPTAVPTARPTVAPTARPTAVPTARSTAAPTPTPRPTPKPTVAPTPIPTPKPTPKPTVAPTTAPPTTGLTAAQWCAEIFRLTNVERAKAGLPALKTGTTALAKAAAVRASEIVSAYSHVRPNGSYFSTVLAENGIAWSATVENLFCGTADRYTPADVMLKWMNSSGHRANILNKNQTMLSVGYVRSGGKEYFVQLFIKPK